MFQGMRYLDILVNCMLNKNMTKYMKSFSERSCHIYHVCIFNWVDLRSASDKKDVLALPQLCVPERSHTFELFELGRK
jgi:hypothetical protein